MADDAIPFDLFAARTGLELMFQRRDKLSLWRRVREWLWPSSGWRRSSRYIMHRVLRLNDSPSSIARGLACGAAVAFTPFIGFHFLLSAVFAWAIRGNVIASAIGTLAVGNPWALPFIWLWIYQFGHWMLGRTHIRGLPPDLTFAYIVDHPMRILLPMTLGSIPTAIAVWLIAYWPARIVIRRLQLLRRHRTAERRNLRAASGNGGSP